MRTILLTLLFLTVVFYAFYSKSAAQEVIPWNTYECIGIPATTAMDGDLHSGFFTEYPLTGYINDAYNQGGFRSNDLVACKVTRPHD